MGAFGEGYSWETTYQQDSGDNFWIGGPNVSLGGYSYSEGNGVNGDSTASGIHLGATTADGGYVRLLDDGVLENSPDQWTIQAQVSEGLQHAIITICPLAGCVSHTFTTDAYWPIQTPSFCKDRLCSVRMYTDAPMGAFGPGISWPVYYEQKSADATWIGGPVVSILGKSFSSGDGTNGDGSYHQILSHGTTTFGGSSILYDDSLGETSRDLWTLELYTADDLTTVTLFICPMGDCFKHHLSSSAEWQISMPDFCVDSLCTILRWSDAVIGAFGPGISWPVFYQQSTSSNVWLGGPDIAISGMTFGSGNGLNGDDGTTLIFKGGQNSSGGVASLKDDSSLEMDPAKWTLEMNQAGDLTEATFYICPQTCVFHDVLIHAIFLPMTFQR